MKFHIKAEKSPEVLNYFIETRNRLNISDVVKNPFQSKESNITSKGNFYYIYFKIETLYFIFAYYLFYAVFFVFLIGSILKGSLWFPWWFILIFGFAGLYSFFSSPFFFSFLFIKGLRKTGFKGKASYIFPYFFKKEILRGETFDPRI